MARKSRDRVLEYALLAAEETVLDARISQDAFDPWRVATSFSSSKGGVETMLDLLEAQDKNYFPARANSLFKDIFPHRSAELLAEKYNHRGPLKSWIAACATGNLAVMDAYYLISEGHADAALAGASDASITPFSLAGYHQMKVLATDQMRPFDESRAGFLVGEGSAAFFMETLESAKARGAKIYGEIAAVGMAQETSHALFYSDDEGTLSKMMQKIIQKAELKPADIDYINLHGTATGHGDLYETREIKKAFGAHAYALSTSTIKSMTGHLLGASGAVEVAATLLAMNGGFVPPTIGLARPDPECDLNYTPEKAAEKKIKTAMSISMGFGGQASTILLSKF